MKTLIFYLTGIIALLTLYLGMPVFAFGFVGWIFLALIICLAIGFSSSTLNHYDDFNVKPWGVSLIVISSVLLVGFMLVIVPFFTTATIIRASSYRNLIGNTIKSDISSDLSPINPEDIVIIDPSTAERLGEKKITETNAALGSEIVLGDFTLQKVGDRLYYVSPLLHTGFFKWFKNDYTPGYNVMSVFSSCIIFNAAVWGI